MSLRSLLNQPVTVVRAAHVNGAAGFGVTATRTVVNGNLQQTTTSEDSGGWPEGTPDAALTGWILFCAAGTAIGQSDRVEQGSAVFEVVGQPDAVYGRRGVHHLEVQLRSVT